MKILCMGDLHRRATAPRSRKDDYVKTLAGKVRQIYGLAEKERAYAVIQPGDFFDGHDVPLWVIRDAILEHGSRPLGTKTYCVPGQHDQRYHTTPLENTPLGLLLAAGTLEILGSTPRRCYQNRVGEHANDALAFYGCGWGGEIPVPDPQHECNVLVMHRMVIHKKVLWHDQQDFVMASTLLRKHKAYDLIVTGDNHHFFTETVEDERGARHLINCGSLMRANSDQADHIPRVVLYDTDDRSIKIYRLKVAPAEEVLDFSRTEEDRKRSGELDAFVEQIGTQRKTPDLNFINTLRKLSQEVDPEIELQVKRIIEEANGGT